VRLAFCLYKYFPHGGLAREMLRVAAEAVRRGHTVDIFAGDWRGERPDWATVTVLDAGGLSNHGQAERFIRRLAPRLDDASYDAVVGFNKMPGIDFYYAADGCFAARARRRRSRLYELTPRYRSYRRLEAHVFGPGSRARILLLSEQSRLEYLAYYATAEERMRLLPPTLERVHQAGPLAPGRRAAMRESLGVGGDEALLLMVGSGFRTKGVDRSLHALAALPEGERRRTRLVIAGRGKASAYEKLAAGLGVADRVTFLGARDDVPELLRAADLFLHPARHESAGAVLLEALAAGLPVITTANCGYAPHVRDAGAGTVLDAPFEQRALDRQLLAWLAAPDIDALRDAARRYGQDDALYRMPETAVDHIEQWRGESPAHAFHGYVHPDLAGLARRLPRLEDWLNVEGQVYRQTRDRRTVRFEHQGEGYFLKAHFGVGWKEIAKNLAQLKVPVLGAGNEWLASHVLRALGLPTLTAAAWGQGPGWATRQSFIVTRELRGLTSLEDYAARPAARDRDTARNRRRLIRKVAAVSRTLHGNGVNHRDFYLCHFLLDPASLETEEGDAALHLIDLHRAQVRHRTPRRWRVKDIGGLYYSALDAGLTRNERLRFARDYLGGGSLRRALADHAFWERVERRARALRRAEIRRGYADVSGRPTHLN
jgi:UDP-glucose:(heptosyl)LPS alpha-1,3-glucosyltransferase